ncbi:MAG: DUF927 domain-containing protein [Oscillospiraceae bacterium]
MPIVKKKTKKPDISINSINGVAQKKSFGTRYDLVTGKPLPKLSEYIKSQKEKESENTAPTAPSNSKKMPMKRAPKCANHIDNENSHLPNENVINSSVCDNKNMKIPMFEETAVTQQTMQSFLESAVTSIKNAGLAGNMPVSVGRIGGCIAMASGEDKLEWLATDFSFVRKVKAINGEMYADIQISDDLSNTIVRVPATIFHSEDIRKLEQYGITVSPGYSLTLSIYCKKILGELPTEAAEQQLGFSYRDSKLSFSGYDTGLLTTQNRYDSADEYIEELNYLISESIPIQYVMSASMGAAVMTALKLKYNIDLHSYCINLIGASSTGKTITSRLCASMWGNPNDDKLFSAMLSTNNAMFKRLGGRMGVPVFLDEAGVAGNVRTDEFGYTIYEEREKHRLNSDCTEKISGTWNTIVILTGEEHFHSSQKSQNGGLVVRIHNAENLIYTTSREHADDICDFIASNYGVLGKIFIEHIISHIDSLQQEYEMARDKMREFTEDSHNQYTERLINSYALTYLTAEILNTLGVQIDIYGIAEIMAEQNKVISSEYNLADNAIDVIASYVAGHSSTEIICYGSGGKEPVTSVAITETLVQKILAEAGFKDMKVTISEIDKAGYLIRQGKGERNGRKCRLNFNGVCTTCYKFRLIDTLPMSKPEKKIEKSYFDPYFNA